MAYLHVHVKVQNHQQWRKVFDENTGVRQQFGCQSETILVSATDENEVIILLSFETAEAAQKFSQSTQLREGMQRAGVIPPVQLSVLEER